MVDKRAEFAQDDAPSTLIDSVLIVVLYFGGNKGFFARRPELRALLRQITKTTNQRVHQYFRSMILPMMRQYLNDIAPTLWMLFRNHTHRQVVIDALAVTYCDRPDSVLTLLELWMSKLPQSMHDTNSPDTPQRVEEIVIALGRTLERLASVPTIANETQRIHSQLATMFDIVHLPANRTELWRICFAVFQTDVQKLYALLQKMKQEDSDAIHKHALYLFRLQYKAPIEDSYVSFWRVAASRSTVVEKVLFSLFEHATDTEPMFCSIAFESLFCCAVYKYEYHNYTSSMRNIPHPRAERRSSLRDEVVPWLIMYKQPRDAQRIVPYLLPPLWACYNQHKNALLMTLAQLQSEPHTFQQDVGSCLEEVDCTPMAGPQG